MPLVVDLNADLGEERGDDASLLAIVTTANVAAGGHAGGGDVLTGTVALAARAGVAVGAHPSYPDRAGFGRVSRAGLHTASQLASLVEEQVLAVGSVCTLSGIALSHVKAHGALYTDAAVDVALASAFLDGVQSAARGLGVSGLAVMGMPGTVVADACRERDVPFVAEAFADRAYAPDGTLLPRTSAGAVLHEPDVVAERVLRLVTEGRLHAVDGTDLHLRADTICLHGDTAGAVELARAVRRTLEVHGVAIAAVVPG